MRISRAHWDELIAHAREDAPNECCGYLSATDGLVEAVFRAENPRKSPYGYELDHKSLFAANELDDEGFEVGIYHSHPRSPAPDPACGLPFGAGSPPPHEARASAAAPPSAPRRVRVEGIGGTLAFAP